MASVTAILPRDETGRLTKDMGVARLTRVTLLSPSPTSYST